MLSLKADIEMDDAYDLYSVPVHGGIPTRLSQDEPFAGRELLSFVITPDSSRVIFLSDAIDDNKYELFSVSVTGGTITRLNANLGNDRDVLNYFKISPDAQTVLYLADQGAFDDVFQLYSVPVSGDIPIRLNQDLLSTEDVDLFELTPDGEKVVFTVKESGDNVSNLFYSEIGSGRGRQILNGPLVDTHSSVQDFEVMPDNSGVIYSANQNSLYIQDVLSIRFL